MNYFNELQAAMSPQQESSSTEQTAGQVSDWEKWLT